MTKRKPLIAVIVFVLALCSVLISGITLSGMSYKAQAEGETTPTDVVEYEITVYNGKATDSEGNEITKAAAGTVVTVIAEDWTRIGWAFDMWATYMGTEVEIAFEDATSATTTFIMPACNVGVLGMQRKDVKAISVDKTEITMSVGETAQITATVDPIVLAIEVEWNLSSDDVVKKIAFHEDYEVKGTATVTIEAKSVGTVIVTAVVGDMSATCTVNVTHDHTFAAEWSKDETNHWHAATCGHEAKGDEEAHTFDEGVITKEATEEAAGEKVFTCTVCGYEKKEVLSPLGHTHKLVFVEGEEATCQKDGKKAYYICKSCGIKFKDEAGLEQLTDDSWRVIPAAHKFGEWIKEIPATTKEEGVKGHKDCEFCGKYFDKDGKEIENLTIEKLPSGGGEDKPSDEPTIPQNKGLSGGAIAGIVIAAVIVAGAGGFSVFWFAIRKRSFAELIAAIKALFKKK